MAGWRSGGCSDWTGQVRRGWRRLWRRGYYWSPGDSGMEGGPEGKNTNLRKHSPETRCKNGCLKQL